MAVREQRASRIEPASQPPRSGWLNERLNLTALFWKYGRKAFPVHSTFFLGEMALFSFVILVLTGAYLGFVYVPSNIQVSQNGEVVSEAYASVTLIESLPVANLFRNVHHWAAHLMLASIILHLMRIFFTGSYRKPREVNWIVGIVLFGLTLMAGFVGYSLPYDSFAVTATGIGYSIARSIPWIGPWASELFFGGPFPTLGSLARLYTIHVFILPALITAIIGLHLLVIVKQKHTQPGYARKLAEPGKVMGVPLVPYQALMALQLFFLIFGVLFLLSAFVTPHPIQAYGPPQAATPEVKPDWYLMWIYGFLKIVPSTVSFNLFGASIEPDFIGGLLFPAVVFGVLTLTPWIDRTNRHIFRNIEYLEPVNQSPVRTGLGVGMLGFIGTLFIAAYFDQIGMTLGQIWAVVIIAPIVVGVVAGVVAHALRGDHRFDPHEELPRTGLEPAASTTAAAASVPSEGEPQVPDEVARDRMVSMLHALGDLAPQARQLQNDEETIAFLDDIEDLRRSLAKTDDEIRSSLDARHGESTPGPGS